MLVCKGPYVILQGGPPIEKASNLIFYFYYLEPRVFTKGRYKKTYFLKRKKWAAIHRLEKKNFSLSNWEENFLLLVAFSSDKGVHKSSADQI